MGGWVVWGWGMIGVGRGLGWGLGWRARGLIKRWYGAHSVVERAFPLLGLISRYPAAVLLFMTAVATVDHHA